MKNLQTTHIQEHPSLRTTYPIVTFKAKYLLPYQVAVAHDYLFFSSPATIIFSCTFMIVALVQLSMVVLKFICRSPANLILNFLKSSSHSDTAIYGIPTLSHQSVNEN